MRLFDCYKLLLALITFVLLIAHTSFVNSVYQFSKSQALLLSQVRNHSDFLKYFVRKATNGSSHLPIKQGNSEEELAEYAGCQVKEVVVPIPQPASSEEFYWPLCTVAKRCSGCCYSRELACLPVQTETKTVPVLVVRTDGANFDDGGTVEVDIEEHISCQCQCRLQAQDCNDLTHFFNQSACTCECKRTERCPHRKIWDTKTCSCVCQNTSPCGQGEIFDVENCRCQVDTIFREADRMQHYLQAACRKTCPHSLSLRIPPDSCFCT